MFCNCLLAALALIIVHSIYKGQLMQDLATPLVMRMHNCKTGAAYVGQYPIQHFNKIIWVKSLYAAIPKNTFSFYQPHSLCSVFISQFCWKQTSNARDSALEAKPSVKFVWFLYPSLTVDLCRNCLSLNEPGMGSFLWVKTQNRCFSTFYP